ncbi:MAG: hypothetical protein HY321_07285 [Armatimonadetes bacterium]|nr:hypothetical protein [Armatimonadota bacterium]
MNRKRPKPSDGALIEAHALLLLGSIVYRAGGNPLGVFFGLLTYPFLLAFSRAIQLGIRAGMRGRPLRNAVRVPLYFSPIVILLLVNHFLPDPPNQASPSRSPSGRYVMRMSIVGNRWIVSIRGGGLPRYRDRDSDFVGHLSVYWHWDRQDRLWLYNSDTGGVYYWHATPDGWQKVDWGYGHTGSKDDGTRPPEGLFPDYARKQVHG